MGIRKYHNKYRAAIRVKGQDMQPYFDTEKQAQKFIDLMSEANNAKNSPWSIFNKKRSTAKHSDLPIGWCDYIQKRPLKNGGYVSLKIIACTFQHNKKPIVIRVNYTIKYTRSEAILLLTKRVLARFRELQKMGKMGAGRGDGANVQHVH